MEILGFIVLIACLVIGVRFGGLGLAAVSGIGLTFFVFVVGLVPGKPPIDVMLTIMAVGNFSGSVSFTPLTLPAKRVVEVSVVARPFKKKKKKR